MKLYCYHNDAFVTFLTTDVLPRIGDTIRIDKPREGTMEYIVGDILHIYGRDDKRFNDNTFKDIRVDLKNPFNTCPEDALHD